MEDAGSVAQTMVRHGLEDPADAFDKQDNVQYWEYVKQFHSDYLEKVFEKAQAIAKDFKFKWKHHPEMFPMPAPKQPGGAGGGMASTEKRMVESFVLPSGHVLVKSGSSYSMNVSGETISFSATEDEAFIVAMKNIAARNQPIKNQS
jgi:hypothetical protein